MKPISKVFIQSDHPGRYDSHFTEAGLTVVENSSDGAEAVIAVGGDGTILRTMDDFLGSGLPILGVNAGHIGFLADCELAGAGESAACLRSGDYETDNLPVLKTTSPAGITVRALNEICISRAAEGGILHIRILVDGRQIAVVASDGVMVSTPSGSTAYNLSCGGPILHPNLPGLIVTAICPHLLAIRPIVVPLSSKIELTILRSRGKNPLILADGTAKCGSITQDESITIEVSSLFSRVIRTGRRSDYYAMLGTKLGWGYRG